MEVTAHGQPGRLAVWHVKIKLDNKKGSLECFIEKWSFQFWIFCYQRYRLCNQPKPSHGGLPCDSLRLGPGVIPHFITNLSNIFILSKLFILKLKNPDSVEVLFPFRILIRMLSVTGLMPIRNKYFSHHGALWNSLNKFFFSQCILKKIVEIQNWFRLGHWRMGVVNVVNVTFYC